MEMIRRVVEEEGRAEAENSAREFEDPYPEENEDSQGKTNLKVDVEQRDVRVRDGDWLSQVGCLSARYR